MLKYLHSEAKTQPLFLHVSFQKNDIFANIGRILWLKLTSYKICRPISILANFHGNLLLHNIIPSCQDISV